MVIFITDIMLEVHGIQIHIKKINKATYVALFILKGV